VELLVRTSTVGDHCVLGLSGEIDLATVPLLHNALNRALNGRTGPGSVVVDLDGVYACDDTALGVLLGAAGRARESGGDLRVVCSAGSLRERLARTGFDRAVPVVSSIADIV
jgi:anti-anti-sigma factor